MKRRIFLALVVLMTLIFASCSMSDMYQEKNIASSAYIKIELSDSSRTALPVINGVEDFTSFTLTDNTRPTANVVHVMEQSWETDSSGTALEKMAATKIAVTERALYSFTLSAQKGGALWQGTVSKTMESGVNSLSFELELKSFPVSGYGSLEVTLTVPSIVSAVDAVLKSYNEGSVEEPQDATLSFADGKATYTASNIYASYYVLVFTLWGDTDKTLKLGEWREYARIAADMLSKSAPVIESADDLNRIYRVTFNTNGGSEVLSQTVTGGNPVTRPEINPTKATDEVAIYTFENWYTSSDGGTTLSATAYKFGTPITGDITLYAKWTETAEPHTITFNSNGGTAVNSQTVDYYQKATKPANPKKSTSATAKYTFENWYTSTDNGETLSETPFDFDMPVIEDIALYAKWNAREVELYPITIAETENGSVNVEEAFAEPGDIITLNITPAKTNEAYYKLEGVSVKSGETDITVTDNTFIMPAGNITVSATFVVDKVVYTVSAFIYALGNRCTKIIYDPDAEPGISVYPSQSSVKCVKDVVLRGRTSQNYHMPALESADLRGLDTSEVTDMSYMFSAGLVSGDLSSFDTSNVTNMSHMFSECQTLTSVDLSNFDTSKVTDMSYMFYGCKTLTTLDLSNFDTSKVTDMSYMFSVCNNLATLDLSSFDTSNVTNMFCMFYGCESFTTLDLRSFDTSSVTNMSGMFYGCYGTLNLSSFDTSNVTNMASMFANNHLTTLDLSSFDTSNVTNMHSMFSGCSQIPDLSNLDTSSVTDMSYMFSGCTSNKLTSLNLSNLDTSSVTNMSYMFYKCSGLTSLNLSNLDTSSVTDMSYMFSECTGLTSINLSNLDTSNVSNMSYMFYKCTSISSVVLGSFNSKTITSLDHMFSGCTGLISVDLSHFDASKVTDMSYMFSGCTKLTTLDFSNLDTSSVTDMSCMFGGCTSLTSLDLRNLNTNNVAYMERMFTGCTGLTSIALSNLDRKTFTSLNYMFYKCSKLKSVDLSNFSTYKVVSMSYMFYFCSSLTTLNLSNFDTSRVTNMSYMFCGCDKLAPLDISNFDTSSVTDMSSMFSGCTSLSTLNLSNFDTSSVTDMSAMFYGCKSFTTLDIRNFDTSKVTNMENMFDGCTSLTTLDLSNFNTSKVSNMQRMFDGCTSLTSLDLSNFDTSKVSNMFYMFYKCSSLTTLDLSSFNTSNVTDMSAMFADCSNLKTIYASKKFVRTKVEQLMSMFSRCYALEGGSGTKYAENQPYGLYMHIDGGESNPGYFTAKP